MPIKNPIARFALVGAGLALCLLSSAPANAATLYWNGVNAAPDAGGGAGTWNTATNWQTAETGGSAVAWNNTTPDSGVFGVTGGTVTLGAARSAAAVTFTAGGYFINTSTRILTIGAGGITQTAAVGSANQIGTGSGNSGHVTLSASQEWLNQSNQNFTQRDGTIALGANTLTLTSTGGGGMTAAGTTTGAGNIVVSANTAAGMSGNNTYSGTTTIRGILTINSLTNFNVASGLGLKASNLSSNLVIDGGTLRVQVSAGTSDRLFTVGAGGATLEAMLTGGNSGQINFTGATAITYTGVGNRTLTIGGTSDDAGGSSIARVIGDVGGGNGTVALAKTGVQDWTVSGTNTYTGGTTVSGAGTLTMGSSSALGSTSGQLTVNAGTLNMVANNLTVGNLTGTGGTISGTSGARTLTIGQGDFGGGDYQGAIANGAGGTTALTKTGTGTITLSGTNSYTGATAVNAGTLRVNGTHTGGGTYTLASGATLGGSGTTASALDVSGIIAPGNSIGTLNTGAVTWNGAASAGSGTDWVFELGASNTADLLNITGNFSKVTGVGSVFRFDFAASTATGTFDLATWSGSTGFAAPDFSYTNLGGANTGSFQISGSTLQFVAVPEPASLAILAGGGLMALGVLRRKLRR